MLAASYWSLLSPALDLAEQHGWGELEPLILYSGAVKQFAIASTSRVLVYSGAVKQFAIASTSRVLVFAIQLLIVTRTFEFLRYPKIFRRMDVTFPSVTAIDSFS